MTSPSDVPQSGHVLGDHDVSPGGDVTAVCQSLEVCEVSQCGRSSAAESQSRATTSSISSSSSAAAAAAAVEPVNHDHSHHSITLSGCYLLLSLSHLTLVMLLILSCLSSSEYLSESSTQQEALRSQTRAQVPVWNLVSFLSFFPLRPFQIPYGFPVLPDVSFSVLGRLMEC